MAQRVLVPAEVAALELLDRVDYEDAFTISVPVSRGPEDWVRFGLDGTPPALLGAVRRIQLDIPRL